MLSLFIGGSASGKSSCAEEYLSRFSGKTIYLATMVRYGRESLERIEKHRKNREDRGFETLECPMGLERLQLPSDACVLLECLGNLTANELFLPEGGGEEALFRGIRHLIRNSGNLTIVANEVFSGGADYEGDTLRYMQILGHLTCEIAAEADVVYEVVCGIPRVLKKRQGCEEDEGDERDEEMKEMKR